MNVRRVRTSPETGLERANDHDVDCEAFTRARARENANTALLVIPGDPPSLNDAMRGRLRHRIRDKKQWQAWTYAAWLEAGRPTFKRPEVRVRCYFATVRKRDAENYAMKPLIDALTRAGAWEDDNADVYLQHRAELHIDPAAPRVELEIRERDA